MARPKGPPDQIRRRRELALELLASGMGVRAVAREVGCDPAAVVRWRDAGATGSWDPHNTGGSRWHDDDRVRARAARSKRLAPTFDQELKTRQSRKPAWLTAKRVRRLGICMSTKLPMRINSEVITAWNISAVMIALEMQSLVEPLNADTRAEFLQQFQDVTSLVEHHLPLIGFCSDATGVWIAPPEETWLKLLNRWKS